MLNNLIYFVQQLLAHENQLASMMITTRFIDGLKDDLDYCVHSKTLDLDITCSLALLQEDMMSSTG